MQFESFVGFRNQRSLIRNAKGTACMGKVKLELLFLISCASPLNIYRPVAATSTRGS